jgi:hypothetical protein
MRNQESKEPADFRIYRSKAVLLRNLRELGAGGAAETCSALRSMPDDLREARRADATRLAPRTRIEALAAE